MQAAASSYNLEQLGEDFFEPWRSELEYRMVHPDDTDDENTWCPKTLSMPRPTCSLVH